MVGLGLLLLIVLATGIALIGLSALLVILLGILRRRRWFVVAGSITLAMVAGVAAWIFASDQPVQRQSLDQKARALIHLPTEANVVAFVEGDWAGDVTVRFQLPATKTKEQWVNELWRANLKDKYLEQSGSDALDRSAAYAGNGQHLWYDAKTDQYVYETRSEV